MANYLFKSRGKTLISMRPVVNKSTWNGHASSCAYASACAYASSSTRIETNIKLITTLSEHENAPKTHNGGSTRTTFNMCKINIYLCSHVAVGLTRNEKTNMIILVKVNTV
jgi:hypothetical protein